MKNLLILGTARSGKTTLAGMVNNKLGYSIVSIDSMVSAFQEVYPDIGIKHHGICDPLISPFVCSYLNTCIFNFENNKFVCEGWHMHPKSALKYLNKKDFHIIVLGYPNLTPKQAFDNIRKYAKGNDYTITLSDERLLEIITRHVNHSKIFEQECKELNLPFYDTSYNREEVLKQALKDFEKIRNKK